MATAIQFGTDGWRGILAEDFTFENVRRVAQAIADFWQAEARKKGVAQPRAVVGYDTRFLSDRFAATAAEVLAGNGIGVVYAAAASPSPAVSFAVKDCGLIGGVMITASHNPAEFNGVKIKADFGGPADAETTRAIEALLDRDVPQRLPFETARGQGMIMLNDVRVAHRKALERFVDLDRIARAELAVVVDSMFGAGAREIESLLASRGVAVTTLRATRDVLFGGVKPEPIAENLGELSACLRSQKADIGVVTDGDADRVGAVDGQGNYITTHYCYAMLLLHMLRHRKQTGSVIKSLTTTSMVDRICAKFGVPLRETPVGFKWVARCMREEDVLMGGEEAGGMGFKGHIPERDGILACLLLLEFLAFEGKSAQQIMAEMDAEFGPSRYARLDMSYPLEKRQVLMDAVRKRPVADLLGSPLAELKDYDGVKLIAQDGAWLMLRASGTEPVVRIYAEAYDQTRADGLVSVGRELAAKI
jgi:alpha-D-glucose phosphate-specific phosphoglucomutase